jgi:DNA-directed RNA polymerase sigma subunit (sigma70/sigma32)
VNLSKCGGMVPVYVGGESPYKLVPFPTREQFDVMYKSNSVVLRDKYWAILKKRAEGHTLQFIGNELVLTKQRIRAIEARFLRKVALFLTTEKL